MGAEPKAYPHQAEEGLRQAGNQLADLLRRSTGTSHSLKRAAAEEGAGYRCEEMPGTDARFLTRNLAPV